MKLNPLALLIVLGAAAVLIACVVTDHSQAGAVVGLLTTVAGAAAPQLVGRKPPEVP